MRGYTGCFLACALWPASFGALGQSPAASAAATPPSAPRVAETLTGTVEDAQGALIAGAKVVLHSPDGTPDRTVATGPDGRFRLGAVTPGHVRLRITMQGFEPTSVEVTLTPGTVLDLPVISLPVSGMNVTVDAILPEQLAARQLHAEEQQRLVGILPNFYVSYDWNALALTPRQKFSLATHNAIDPGNIFLSATVAGVQQASDSFPGYHQGAEGYAKRFGADLANLEIGTYMGGAVLPTLFRQDPRYFYKGTGTVRARFVYAVTRAVVARGDNGRWQPAYASVLGDLSAGALSNLYYAKSDRQGAALTLENGFLGVAGDALNDVFEEFVLKKLTPRLRNASSNAAPTDH